VHVKKISGKELQHTSGVCKASCLLLQATHRYALFLVWSPRGLWVQDTARHGRNCEVPDEKVLVRKMVHRCFGLCDTA
jgi:hypothetical protein